MPFTTIFFVSLGGLIVFLGFKTWEVRGRRQVAAAFFARSDRLLVRAIIKITRFCRAIIDFVLPRLVYLSVKLGKMVRSGFRGALKGVRALFHVRRGRPERKTTSAYFSRIAKMRHKG